MGIMLFFCPTGFPGRLRQRVEDGCPGTNGGRNVCADGKDGGMRAVVNLFFRGGREKGFWHRLLFDPANGDTREMAGSHETLRNAAVVFSLKRTPVFAGLAEDDLEMIARFAVLRNFSRGEYLFRQREPAHGFYIVRRGIINVHRVAADGREQVIHLFRPPESFAENSLASDGGYLTDARSVGESEVILVPKWEFLQILRQRADISLRIVASMSQHMRGLITSLESATLKDAETRLMNWILRRCPRPLTSEATEVAIGMTKAMLSGELGTRQETLSRTLARLRDAGLVAVRGRTIKVLDPVRLDQAFRAHLSGREGE